MPKFCLNFFNIKKIEIIILNDIYNIIIITMNYYWVKYDYFQKKYMASSVPCYQLKSDNKTTIGLTRDLHFSSEVKLGDKVKIILVSIPSFLANYVAIDVIDKYFNKGLVASSPVNIVKQWKFTLPSDLDSINDSNYHYDVSDFDDSKELSKGSIYKDDFRITFCSVSKKSNTKKEKKIFYYSHPTFVLNN